MVKYIMMKRLTQLLASLLFILTVVTVYLAFDFVITSATPSKNHSHKQPSHAHIHHNSENEIKISRKRSVPTSWTATKKYNDTVHHDSHQKSHDYRVIPSKKHGGAAPARPKSGGFHKGKTGIKLNQAHKPAKKRIRNPPQTTHPTHHNEKPHSMNRRQA